MSAYEPNFRQLLRGEVTAEEYIEDVKRRVEIARKARQIEETTMSAGTPQKDVHELERFLHDMVAPPHIHRSLNRLGHLLEGALKAAYDAEEIGDQLRRRLARQWPGYVCAHEHRWRSEAEPTRCPNCNTSSFAATEPEEPK